MSRPGLSRIAVVCDYPEEGWHSMDLTGEMVLRHLVAEHANEFTAARVGPPFRRRFGRLPRIGRQGPAQNADRLLNRLHDYPRALARLVRRNEFDLYHLVDHSYSQLVHVLPPGRAIVTCHDLDTFRCLLEPGREPRPAWFRTMTRHILDGLRKAAAVSCDSEATRDALLTHALLPADRLHVVSLGIPPEFTPDPDPRADATADRLLGPADPNAPPDLLHVGSNIPRKRIDVLLAVVAEVRRQIPGVRLLKMGGALPADLMAQARALGLADSIVVLPYFAPGDRAIMAAVYRRAALVLQPSAAEGFGLPVVEALACGVPLLASDIAVLREVAGAAATYCPVGDIAAWTAAALRILGEHQAAPETLNQRRAAAIARARLYTWTRHVDQLTAIYREVLTRPS